jgi:secreted trypsin-like serine protease
LKKINGLAAAAVGVLLLGLLASATPASAVGVQPSPSATVTPNIVGGHTPSQPYPAMASLQINHHGDPNWHLCGAVLVSHRYAVTNAHCVTNYPDGSAAPATLFHLRVGSPDRTSGGVLAGVTQVLPHADWAWATGPGPVADVALLRLDTYLQLQPFEIAPRLPDHSTVRLLGWGVTEPSGQGPAPINLQELDTTLLPAQQCAAAGITAGEICVINPHGSVGACYGDSGGPALQRVGSHRWEVIGGASRETTPMCGTGPAVYTDVAYYRDWIYQVMRTGKVPSPTTSAQAPAPRAATRSLHWAGSA